MGEIHRSIPPDQRETTITSIVSVRFPVGSAPEGITSRANRAIGAKYFNWRPITHLQELDPGVYIITGEVGYEKPQPSGRLTRKQREEKRLIEEHNPRAFRTPGSKPKKLSVLPGVSESSSK